MAETSISANNRGSGDPLYPGQWYQSDTYYQILEVKPAKEGKKREGKNISTTILARKRGSGNTGTREPDSFDDFDLDRETIEKLKDYPRNGDDNKLSSYLPFPGVVFPEGFIKTLSNDNSNQTELGNFYPSIRIILQSRKLSQLIARTWWTYLEAKKNINGEWDKFTSGEWDDIPSNILDGLIARELFLYAGGASPDNPTPEDINIYNPLKAQEVTNKAARFLILPTSKAWQGIMLSLLFSGQAYYLNKKDNKYHQIAQSVLSTGEIVFNYSFESDWSIFQGHFKELKIDQGSPWMISQAVMPYPPIPSSEQLDPNDIKKWAEAEESGGDFPFYNKQGETFVIDVDYFRSPYPYIPLSTS